MLVRVGITASDLVGKTHDAVTIIGRAGLIVAPMDAVGAAPAKFPSGAAITAVSRGREIFVSAGGGVPSVKSREGVTVKPADGGVVTVASVKRAGARGSQPAQFQGVLELTATAGKTRLVLVVDLESYLRGVLQSEMPASYHAEALKTQAVTARTYALRPRIDHQSDGFDVCDSYLCCQYFAGLSAISPKHDKAIDATKGEVLTFEDKPILALFSSCAGGHTESYENCFSDPKTNEFPPAPLPYLKGVPEGRLPEGFPGEKAMRELWEKRNIDTADAWSPHFSWQVAFRARDLEGHMHHVVATMRDDPQMAPFITAPPGGKFGHIERLEVVQRGVAGTVVVLDIHTSTGAWRLKKELVIRSAFKNPDLGLSRLKSARIMLEHQKDKLGLLSHLSVRGLGWGHGVGMQQTGAQGLALSAKGYRDILAHYFHGAQIERV